MSRKLTYPRLMVLQEKHGSYYYLVENEEELLTVALKVVAERLENGTYCRPNPVPPFPEFFSKEYGMELTDVQSMNETTKLMNTTSWKPATPSELISHAERQHRQAAFEFMDYETISEAVEQQDGNTAIQILYDRCDYEYEFMDLVRFDNRN